MFTLHRNATLRITLYVLLVLLISNLGAMVELVLNPEIPYFDREHLIVGGITAITVILLLGALEAYLARRRRIEAMLRESEEWHRTILQTTMDGFWLMDTEGCLLEVNEIYCRMSGYSAKELMTMRVADVEDADSAAGIARRIEKVVAQGTDRFESRHRRKDRSLFDVEVSVHYLPIEGGRLVAFVQDITERKRAKDEILRLNDELEERVLTRTAQLEASNRELEAFVYSASHDLRAPLRAIDGFCQMVAEDAADRLGDADVDHLQRARAASQRIALLIDNLLKLSRASRIDLLYESVDLSAMAETVLADLRSEQPERRVEAVIQPGLEADADATLLHLILSNLLDNAWKFTSKHEAARIEVGALDAGGEPAYFVRDDGAGFNMARAQHLFGAFQRFHTADQFDGDGIGLATVQRLVAKHGGRVWAEAEVEKGATFYFTLPKPIAAA
jgi:PAS domain S-box-containing protein